MLNLTNKLFRILIFAILTMLAGCQSIVNQGTNNATLVSPPATMAQAPTMRCKNLLAEHEVKSIRLNLKEFDQTPTSGWRALESENCFREGASLITFYMERNNVKHTQLSFHAGQLLAIAGDYTESVAMLKKSLLPSSTKSGDFLWNDYVLGTIAFLERDKAKLALHKDALFAKQGANVPNYKILQKLFDRFEESYDDILK